MLQLHVGIINYVINYTELLKTWRTRTWLDGSALCRQLKVVSVFHSRNENLEAVNFKKSIAAAFQANFKGTTQEEETDSQSKHIFIVGKKFTSLMHTLACNDAYICSIYGIRL